MFTDMDEKGFTLLEVLASVAILGLGIVAVLRLFSGSMGLAKASSDSAALVLFAREKMNEELVDEEIREGAYSGTNEGFNWAMDVKEFDGLQPVEGVRILKVQLKAGGPSGAPVKIATLKLVSDKK